MWVVIVVLLVSWLRSEASMSKSTEVILFQVFQRLLEELWDKVDTFWTTLSQAYEKVFQHDCVLILRDFAT